MTEGDSAGTRARISITGGDPERFVGEPAQPAKGSTGRLTAVTIRAFAAPSARRGLLTLTTLVAALSLSGCALFSPVQTDEPAQTADGIDVALDADVVLRSLLIVAAGEGEPGRVSAQVVNNTDQDVDITFEVPSGSADVTVPAHGSANLADDEFAVTLSAVPAGPGDMTDVQVSTSQAGINVFSVPVVEAIGYYADVTPQDQ